jgi:hypothetical protein
MYPRRQLKIASASKHPTELLGEIFDSKYTTLVVYIFCTNLYLILTQIIIRPSLNAHLERKKILYKQMDIDRALLHSFPEANEYL